MKINSIYYSSYFAKNFQNLEPDTKQQLSENLSEFKKNCFAKKINVQHLNKNLKGYWSLKITNQHSVLFEFINGTTNVGFIDISDNTLYS